MRLVVDTNVLISGRRSFTSGDKHLLSVSGYAGIAIMRPRSFEEKYLK